MDKNAIKKFAVWARWELIERVSQKAMQYGIEKDNIVDAAADSINGKVLTDTQKNQRRALIAQINAKGYEEVMEEVAYTWFNRLIALRFMEVNGYLPTRVRVFTDEENNFKPQIIDEALHLDLDGLNMDKVYEFKNANQTEELYKYLLITQCNALNSVLPGMFQRISDYTELLLPDNLLREGSVIEKMISTIPEEDWQDAVQIIGWLYQYYISEKHDEIVNINKGTIKQEDIPAATQLFTTDWVVRYMVDNSLGHYWIERHPESNLAEKLEFLVKPKDGKIQTVNEPVTLQDLTFFDPCMGSGHILAYAFDVLMEIYREYGYTDREAVAEIVQNNLHGFDIDERCTQLAYFVVMMKARQYDTRFFKRGIYPQVYCPKADSDLKAYGSLLQIDTLDAKPVEPEEITLFDIDYSIKLNDWNCRRLLSQKYAVVCTNPPYLNKYNDKLKKFVTENYRDYSGDLFSVFIYRNFGFCKKEGYAAFMTPFVWMFIKTYEKLRKYIINSKSITSLIQMEYSAFEEATVPICSFVLQNCKSENKSLCFRLSDFKGGMEVQKVKVLEALQNPNCGYFYEAQQSNFSKIPGSPVAYWVGNAVINDFQHPIRVEDVSETRIGMATANNDRFMRLWYEVPLGNVSFSCSSREAALLSGKKWFTYCKGGSYRKWYGNLEYIVNWKDDGKEIQNFRDEKTGRVRSHNYNLDYIFKPGLTFTAISSSNFSCRIMGEALFGSGGSGICHISEENQLPLLGFLNSKIAEYLLGCLSLTMNFEVNTVGGIPFIVGEKRMILSDKVKGLITLSKTDWDSFETSWDFKRHPLLNYGVSIYSGLGDGKNPPTSHIKVDKDEPHFKIYEENKPKAYTIQSAFEMWEAACNDRFVQLKANEEELNRILIDIYGLHDELTPEVEDKDVTVRKADLTRDIKSLISYAVGCMFGRYSPLKDGLLYAGGEWNYEVIQKDLFDAIGKNEFSSGDMVWNANFIEKDNIIPICDDEYFDDDIVGRFITFISDVYGKDTLDENLKFIADALGGKGQPREVIRNYFLNDFYADHCKIYQKRPIYWLFDSGKKNGFKSLIYMHRYQPDTIARIRTDYVHEQQSRYRTAIADMENRIANASTGERMKLNKALTKLKDQDDELRSYEEKIHHLADQMITIDLDDGVKVNYAKFQDVLAKIK